MTATNKRYMAYAAAHGRTPRAMLAADRRRWPGGCMVGFILWMSWQKADFRKASPGSFIDRDTIGDHAAWTAFLLRVAGAEDHRGQLGLFVGEAVRL